MNQRLFRIILIGICAGTGALAQSLSLHAVRKREKMFGGSSTQAGEDRSSDPSGSSDDSAAARDSGPSATGSRADENRGGADGLGQAEEGSRTGGIRRPGEAGSPAQAAGAGYGSGQRAAAQDSSGLDVFTRYELKNLEDMEADISGKASEIAKELTATVARAVASARLSDRAGGCCGGTLFP